MSRICITVTLRAFAKRRRKYEADFLIDLDLPVSMAPESDLAKAGIERRGQLAYESEDGSIIEFDFGLAEFEIMGERTAGRIIFAPDEFEPRLGFTALDSVAIIVDPISGTFERRSGISLTNVPSSAVMWESQGGRSC